VCYEDAVNEVAALLNPVWVKDGFSYEYGSERGFKDESHWSLDEKGCVPDEIEVQFVLNEDFTVEFVQDELIPWLAKKHKTSTRNDEVEVEISFTEPYAQAFGPEVRMVCMAEVQ